MWCSELRFSIVIIIWSVFLVINPAYADDIDSSARIKKESIEESVSSSKETPNDDMVDPGQITFRDPIGDTAHEFIDPYTGSLDRTYTDLHLPGDGGLDFKIIRTFKSTRITDTALEDRNLGYAWQITFGKLKVNGRYLAIELYDGTTSTAVREKAGSPYYYSKDLWRVYMPPGNNPPVLQLTDGITITFGHRYSGDYFATEIRKNNDTIVIAYNGRNIQYVRYKNDGVTKTVNFNYYTTGRKHLQSITWGSPKRQITYSYNADDTNLESAVLPGGDTWQYTHKMRGQSFNYALLLDTVTTPWGGHIDYEFGIVTKPAGDPFTVKLMKALFSKEVSGRKLANGVWNYSYDIENGYDTTTITDSDNRTTTYRFYGYGSSFSEDCYKYSLPISKVVMNGNTHEITTKYEWDRLPESLSTYPYRVQHVCSDIDTYVPIKTSEKIIRGNKEYLTLYSDFDTYGQPQTITERGTNTKTTNISYWYDIERNIVKGKPLSVTTTGDAAFTGTFTSTYSYYDDPTADSGYFGELKTASPNGITTIYTYDDIGNLSSITDANLNTTNYSWNNGSISQISNPYYNISRTVNWDGTIASETDGRNNTTYYTYDAAMRLVKTTPPVGNLVMTT